MKDTQELIKKNTGSEGIALLFVVLLTSVILLVTIGITNVSYKEALFSVEAQDSDVAYYASDTGFECALLLERQGYFDSTPPATSPSCNGIVPAISPLPAYPAFSFVIPFASTDMKACAKVFVDRQASSGTQTWYRSYGYNVSAVSAFDCQVGTPDPHVVTRGFLWREDNSSTVSPPPAGPLPTISTLTPMNVSKKSAKLLGTVLTTAGHTMVSSGFFWGTTPSTPTLLTPYSGSPFTYDLNGLTCATTYMAWAFTVDSTGSQWSAASPGVTTVSFTTSPCFP